MGCGKGEHQRRKERENDIFHVSFPEGREMVIEEKMRDLTWCADVQRCDFMLFDFFFLVCKND